MSAQTFVERNPADEQPRFKLNKANSKSSTSSMLNAAGFVNDEDDPFYDASEFGPVNAGEEGQRLASSSRVNPYAARLKHLQEVHNLESVTDDSLFDTPLTSRHASEICTELNSPRVVKGVAVFSPLACLPSPTGEPVAEPPGPEPAPQQADVQSDAQVAQESGSLKETVKVNIERPDDGVEEEEVETPLETPWTFWYDWCEQYTNTEDFEKSLKKIITVNSVEDFWSVFNHIIDISKLENRYSYHLMRGNRRPIWEDAENSAGGIWKIAVQKSDTSFMWREMAMAAIGEQLSDSLSDKDDIVGISVGRREKNDNINIWNLDSQHAEKVPARLIGQVRSLAPGMELKFRDYKAHRAIDTTEVNKLQMNKKGSYNRPRSSHAGNSPYHANHNHNYHQSNNLSSHYSGGYHSNNNSRHQSPSGFQFSKQ